MVKLRTLLISAEVRWEMNLKFKLNNDARWNSTYLMLLKYVELKKYVLDLDEMEIDTLSLSLALERKVHNLVKKLGNLNEVTK